MAKRLFLLGCLASILPVFAEEIVWELDPAQTQVEFSLADVLHKVHGSFSLKRGSIRFDPAGGKASGEVIVDVSSGDSGSHARDKRMHKDILQSDRYTEAVFTPDRIEGRLAPQGNSNVDVHGILHIHGAEHEMALHAQVQTTGDRITASGHFTMPYVKWGMKNPSTLLLRVSDHVEIDIHPTGRVARPAS